MDLQFKFRELKYKVESLAIANEVRNDLLEQIKTLENYLVSSENDADGKCQIFKGFVNQSPIKDQGSTITERKESEQALKNNEIELLLNGSRLVLESKDFITTAQQIFDYCRELTGAKAGYVALLNENGEENDVVYLEPGGMPCAVNPALPMPIRGLREVVYKTGVTTFENSYANSPHVRFMPKGHMPLKNVMFAPLKNQGKTIGLLGLGEKEDDFTDYDAKIATSFAELISVALINSNNLDVLKQNEQQLIQLNADKDKFISILSHDLKSPFIGMIGLLELLQSDVRDYDMDTTVSRISLVLETAQNAHTLLDDILLWAHVSSGKMPYNPKELSLKTICSETVAILKPNADLKRITIKQDIDDDLEVDADRNMLNTILRNLISNAIKFTNVEGSIEVTAKRDIDSATITVSDNGVGIEPDRCKRLFDISRMDSTEGTANEKGTGLGLLLCKELVERHGGTIWAESEVGKGSKVIFSLPLWSEKKNTSS
jgi:signal transduction histidine kinase